jgi:hypothetical protein
MCAEKNQLFLVLLARQPLHHQLHVPLLASRQSFHHLRHYQDVASHWMQTFFYKIVAYLPVNCVSRLLIPAAVVETKGLGKED